MGSSGASSFTYFNSTDAIDPLDYEVMVTLGTATGFSNIGWLSGTALGVWASLSSSPFIHFLVVIVEEELAPSL